MPKKIKMDNFLGAAEKKIILNKRGIGSGKVLYYYRNCTLKEKKIVEMAAIKLFKNLNISNKFKIKI